MLKKHDTAVLVTPIARWLPEIDDADWIGIDMGCSIIQNAGKEVAFAIGDFDSGKLDENAPFEVEIHPVAKDETDTELALLWAQSMGYENILLIGGLGGRLDHTLANLRCMLWKVPQTVLLEEKQKISVLLPGDYEFTPEYRHVSFFAAEPSVITLEDFDYPLHRRLIDEKDFYTCSNSISKARAFVRLEKGRVLCVQTSLR